MTALIAFLSARRKAIGAFVAAEAGTFLTLLQASGPITVRGVLCAALAPIAVGAVAHQAVNT